MQVAVPDRQGTESTPNYEARVSSFLSEYMTSQGITSWSEGFASAAAHSDHEALETVLRARRSIGGDVSLAGFLSPRWTPHIKHQKYPRR